jgi:exonuclease VII small subunit
VNDDLPTEVAMTSLQEAVKSEGLINSTLSLARTKAAFLSGWVFEKKCSTHLEAMNQKIDVL